MARYTVVESDEKMINDLLSLIDAKDAEIAALKEKTNTVTFLTAREEGWKIEIHNLKEDKVRMENSLRYLEKEIKRLMNDKESDHAKFHEELDKNLERMVKANQSKTANKGNV